MNTKLCDRCKKEYPIIPSPSPMIGLPSARWDHTPSDMVCLQAQLDSHLASLRESLDRISTAMDTLESMGITTVNTDKADSPQAKLGSKTTKSK